MEGQGGGRGGAYRLDLVLQLHALLSFLRPQMISCRLFYDAFLSQQGLARPGADEYTGRCSFVISGGRTWLAWLGSGCHSCVSCHEYP